MLYTKSGSCNQCGKCCMRPYIDTASAIELQEDRCKFYVDKVNIYPFGHCLIYGRGGKPITNVKDRFGKTITQQQIDWFNQNCIDYPTASDKQVWDSFSGTYPPAGCSFNFTPFEVEG